MSEEKKEDKLTPPVEKAPVATPPEPKAEVVEKKKETITVDKQEFADLLARVTKIEQARPEDESAPEKPKGPSTARVHFIGGSIVTGYGKTWEERNSFGEYTLMVEVFTADEKTHKVSLVDFREKGDQKEAVIKDIKVKEVVTNYGETNKVEVDWAKYRSRATDKTVPLEVKSQERTFTLTLPDGEEVILKEEALN
tara:strand:+ start:605 stop:1192 length:588 start_codon:yes stop_codon:yes gene_type:complete